MIRPLDTTCQVLQYLLPSCCQTSSDLDVNQVAQESFKNNHYKLKARSIMVGVTCYALALTSIVLLCLGASPIAITAVAATSIFVGILWHVWGNKSFILLKAAHQAMDQKNEDFALECIKKGANIFELTGGEIFSFTIFPLFPFHSGGVTHGNILEKAVITDSSQVADYLLQLGFYDETILTDALSNANNLEIAEKLLERGANIQLSHPPKYSSLYTQLLSLQIAFTQPERHSEDFFEKKLQVVELFLARGAKLQPQDVASKDQIVDKFKSFNTENETIKQSISRICEKLDN